MNKKTIYSNYKRNIKFLGVIDYKSLVIILIYSILLWNVLNFFIKNIEYLIYIYIVMLIPVFIVLFINLEQENTSGMILNILKFLIVKKEYFKVDKVNNHEYKKYIL